MMHGDDRRPFSRAYHQRVHSTHIPAGQGAVNVPVEVPWRPTHRRAVLGVFAIGLLVRLAVAPYGGHYFDIPTFQFWAYHLVRDPLSEFYHLRQQFLAQPDHLPGDLWLLWGVGRVFHLFSPEMDVETPGFVWLVKLVPALADLGIAWVLYLLGAHWWSRNAGLIAAVLVLLNPGVVFLTSVWGQWNSVATFFGLLTVWLYVSGRLGWVLPTLTYATLIKPQFFALFPLLALAYYFDYVRRDAGDEAPRREGYWGDVLTPVAAGGLISIALAAVLCLPFGVGLFGVGEWSIIERVRIAADTHPYSTMWTFNLWGALRPPEPYVERDSAALILGLSARQIGIVLTAVAYVAILVRYGSERRHPLALLWAVLAIMLVLYILPTRIHGRYLLPVVVLSALPAVMDAYYRRIFVVLSLTFLVNTVVLYWLQDPPRILIAGAIDSKAFWVVFSLINVAAAGALLWRLPRVPSSGRQGARQPADDEAHEPAPVLPGASTPA